MSKKPTRPLNIDEVNKKILAKAPKSHFEHELIGPLDKYRDENFEIYERKKRQFLETAKTYQNNNKVALYSNKIKLAQHSDDVLAYDFEHEQEEPPENLNVNGALIRKRTERPIHEETIVDVAVCNIEPWFRRYLILSKFIQAVRAVILKNRLLKNLEILRNLTDDDLERLEVSRNFDNVTYANLFEKFIPM